MVAAAIAGAGARAGRRASRASASTELPECGTNDEVLAHHGLDVASLAAVVSRGRRQPSPGAVLTRMTVLFWDIDGTLLTTAKAGMFAWDDAVREMTGREFELVACASPGLTDYQIAARTFEMLGLDTDEALLRSLRRRYEELLPSSLPRKHGQRAAERARDSRAPARTRRTSARTC